MSTLMRTLFFRLLPLPVLAACLCGRPTLSYGQSFRAGQSDGQQHYTERPWAQTKQTRHSETRPSSLPLFERRHAIERALETVRRLDVPARQYLVTVTTSQDQRSRDELMRLGFTWNTDHSAIGTNSGAANDLPSTGRVTAQRGSTRSRQSSSQTVRVMTGSTASLFIGSQAPVVTSNGPGLQTVSTLAAGTRLNIRAIGPAGPDAVTLALSTERSNFIPTTNGLPATRQAVTETTVRAEIGKPCTIAVHETTGNDFSSQKGSQGVIRFSESSSRPLRLGSSGQWQWQRRGSFETSRRRHRTGGSLLVTLIVRRGD